MTVGTRAAAAILAGIGITVAVFLIPGATEGDDRILLWNVTLISRMAGDGPVIGHDANGDPMHEGTPVHVFFLLFGLASTLPIYIFISYVLLTIGNKIWWKPAEETDDPA